MAELETLAALPEGNRAPEDTSYRAAVVVDSHGAADLAAFPAPIPGAAAAGVRKRKAPASARKPRKPKLQDQPIQIDVYYGHRRDFSRVTDYYLNFWEKEVGDVNKCAHVTGELPPQPWLMTFVDLRLWIFKLFRLHPETQDLNIKGFFKEHTWDNHSFLCDKSWRSFARKLKRRRNMVPKFMLYVESSEINHYSILLKAVNDGYSVALPEKECLKIRHLVFPCPVEDLAMTATELAACLSNYNGEQISPLEAWRARQYALEREFGTFYESYNIAPRLLKRIVHKNPGSFVEIKGIEVAGSENFQVLHRIFWAFAQCLQTFQHCRPVLFVKGTPLCGKYQGVLLTAVALDANDYSIPVACAVVEDETKESWLWFFRNLEQALVKRSNVCIIHNYQNELIDAIEDLLKSPQTPCIWKHSRWCMEQLAQNFLAYFGDEKLMMMFKKLCQQRRLHKFRGMWKELDELTSKYMSEKDGGASGEMQQGSVEHDKADLEAQIPCNQPDSMEDGDKGDRADDSKRNITKFSDWIRLKPMEKWSLLHDRNGARFGIMGNNIADVHKHDPVLKGITCLPIHAIVEVTFQRMMKYFKNTIDAANKTITDPSMNFPERIQDDMNSEMQKAQMHQVICKDCNEVNVFGGKQVQSFTVQSRQKNVIVHLNTYSMNRSQGSTIRKVTTCSCNKPQLLRKPCSHVIAVCSEFGINADIYVSPYYSLPYLGSTWRGKFKVPRTSFYYTDFTGSKSETTWIPDKRLECGLPVFLTSDGVQNSAEEEEQQCNN